MVSNHPSSAERQQDKEGGGGLQKDTTERLQAPPHQWRSSGEGAVFQVSWCPQLLRPDMDRYIQVQCKKVSPPTTEEVWGLARDPQDFSGTVESVLTHHILAWE